MTPKRGIEGLIEDCRLGDSATQIRAVDALRGAGATEAIDAITALVSSPCEDVRREAATALGELGRERVDEVGPALMTLLSDPKASVRSEAAESLGVVQYASARPSLEGVLLDDVEWVVRASAAEALGNLGDARAIDALAAAFDDELYPVRSFAAASIGLLGDTSHLTLLRDRLEKEPAQGTQAQLVLAGLRLGDPAMFDALLDLADHIDDDYVPNLLNGIEHLLDERTPDIAITRGVELDRRLATLGGRSPVFEQHAAQLRARLTALRGHG